MENRADLWRTNFFRVVRNHKNAALLQWASQQGQLRTWTSVLTDMVVTTCEAIGWHASARGHKLELLPVPRNEYLSLDVMAFAQGERRWRFPVAVMELENRQDEDYIAYSYYHNHFHSNSSEKQRMSTNQKRVL